MMVAPRRYWWALVATPTGARALILPALDVVEAVRDAQQQGTILKLEERG